MSDGPELSFSLNSLCNPSVSSVNVQFGDSIQHQFCDSLLMLNGFSPNSHLRVEDLISSCARIRADFTQPLCGAGDPLTSALTARVLSARLLVVSAVNETCPTFAAAAVWPAGRGRLSGELTRTPLHSATDRGPKRVVTSPRSIARG